MWRPWKGFSGRSCSDVTQLGSRELLEQPRTAAMLAEGAEARRLQRRGHATVDDQLLARDVAGLVGREEDGRSGDLAGRAPPTDGRP